MSDKFIHAVPNFSEGKREEVIEAVVDQLRDVEGVKLVGYFPDADFNRTVIELIGRPEPLKKALLDMTAKSIELIDMEEQSGDHPRIGAQDTIPIFPLKDITTEECREIAEEIGQAVYDQCEVPVYFSGENARTPEREKLSFIRKGQYEGLKEVAHTPERAPDIGPGALHPSAGAVIVSAGERPLVAYNVILGTDDLEIAKSIAKIVRGPSGGFTTVRAVGLKFSERNQVAVSMNMFDYDLTPLYRTFELIKNEAARYGVSVVASELVGVVPQEALVNSLEKYLQLEDFDRSQILENNLIGL
ncbi:glutamate formimidoyltransferase [Selenihalanaerobacter shriftii]|uniref:glutamate formimidoyltransferase n=1 Tax=Selenihalanaerobacter shriftii TaxID=142842 RepID=A0A1T4R218_9FIRM|nr:glutamate formimidoyltransferase [Selenihalanaerobacter shriftii]SKA09877.1 glutamate formiminotransferase [Selenihalanaerobacter shriftii]